MDDIKPTSPRPSLGARPPRPRISIPISGHDSSAEPVISKPAVRRVAPTMTPVTPPQVEVSPQPEAPAPEPSLAPQPVVAQTPTVNLPPKAEEPVSDDPFAAPPVSQDILSKTEDPEPTAPPEAAGQVSQAPTSQGPKKSHLGAVFIAILVALALVGGAGYAYLQNQKTAQQADTKTESKAQPKTEAPTLKPATEEDITSTNEAIDKSLKSVDDTTDASEADLSDSTLGL